MKETFYSIVIIYKVSYEFIGVVYKIHGVLHIFGFIISIFLP